MRARTGGMDNICFGILIFFLPLETTAVDLRMAPHRQRGPRGAEEEKGEWEVVETHSPTPCRWMLLRRRKPQAIKGT